ncbi:hypothetical protein D6833_11190 [Candidatus Parcubacteria bacterium]|nr:MAG: hypothetical protein D6833_11190 [Candidatus Parcubacteria bacterium]
MKDSDMNPTRISEPGLDQQEEPTCRLKFSQVDSVDDLSSRNPLLPGLVLVTAALVSPVAKLIGALTEEHCWGELARGLERALAGFDERDFRLLYQGLCHMADAFVRAGEQELLALHAMIRRTGQVANLLGSDEAEGDNSSQQKGER